MTTPSVSPSTHQPDQDFDLYTGGCSCAGGVLALPESSIKAPDLRQAKAAAQATTGEASQVDEDPDLYSGGCSCAGGVLISSK